MCIKNELVEKTLKNIREINKNPIVENSKLTQTLAWIKTIQEDLEKSERVIKTILIHNNFKGVEYFPEIERKVYLAEGRSFSEYNIDQIQSILAPKIFTKIINIIQKKVDELNRDDIKKIVEENKITKVGEPYISVSKLNKKELSEYSILVKEE